MSGHHGDPLDHLIPKELIDEAHMKMRHLRDRIAQSVEYYKDRRAFGESRDALVGSVVQRGWNVERNDLLINFAVAIAMLAGEEEW